ncbi:MAG: hypothetical protein WC964_03360 [Acholeplasmataceae bacterium]
MKKIIDFILQPFNFFSGKKLAEKASVFVAKYQFIIYIIAFFVTVSLLFLHYVYPNL